MRDDPSEGLPASKSTLAPGTLAIVATPIGNLGDISRRAVETLTQVAVIACEDTRVTAKLLSAYGIHTPMLSYHEHNAGRVRPVLIARLKTGESVALVSDAGTPLISDPGYKLIEAAVAEGIAVTAMPGASASITALTLSGLPTDRFLFAGFLPVKGGARRSEIRALAAVPATLIFYEAAPRLGGTLADLLAVLGDRRAAVARELTKKFEEVRRGRLSELAAAYAELTPKGEIAIVVGPPEEDRDQAVEGVDLDRALEAAFAGNSLREAVNLVAAQTGHPRRAVYARALALRHESDGPDEE